MVAWFELWQSLTVTSPRRGITYADPLRAGKHPFQIYLLTLCVITGLPVVLGIATPASIEESLPEWLVFLWSLCLLIGSAVALIGVYWPRSLATALTTERIGLALVGTAALVYGPFVWFRLGLDGLLAGAIIMAFGGSCIKRARDLGYIIQTATHTARNGGA